ncbi:MAG: hypothetical protein U1E76_00995 [Planctomycetota bacterium]
MVMAPHLSSMDWRVFLGAIAVAVIVIWLAIKGSFTAGSSL